MWTNPNEIVFTPFMGIGSEVYEAVKNNRYGIGIELKDSYFETARRNIEKAIKIKSRKYLFPELEK